MSDRHKTYGTRKKPWSDVETDILRDNFNKLQYWDLQFILPGRTWHAIRNRANLIGLVSSKRKTSVPKAPRPCARCGSPRARIGGRISCVPCGRIRATQYQNQFPDRVAAKNKLWRKSIGSDGLTRAKILKIRERYGLTSDEYKQKLQSQNGKCAICHDIMSRPVLDHDHASGVARGFLCTRCNLGLGLFGDDPGKLHQAASYLEKSK